MSLTFAPAGWQDTLYRGLPEVSYECLHVIPSEIWQSQASWKVVVAAAQQHLRGLLPFRDNPMFRATLENYYNPL